MKNFVLVFSFFFFATTATFATSNSDTCHRNRGALDVGSGSTKALAALVDICESKIIKVLFDERLPLAFNEALEKSSDGTIPESLIKDAIPQMKKLVSKMREVEKIEISGVATSVFRIAKNGSSVASEISKALEIPLKVISQEEEARLGFLAARSKLSNVSPENLIVWDIGGGSMQMYAIDGKSEKIYRGDLASVTFKNLILRKLQFKDPKMEGSPNPIGRQKENAIQLAKNHAYLNVPKFFKENAKTHTWVGVGGVLSLSVQRQAAAGASEFTTEQAERALSDKVQKSNDQLTGEYKNTDVSNIALVLGYMKALGVTKVQTVEVSLSEGVLFMN